MTRRMALAVAFALSLGAGCGGAAAGEGIRYPYLGDYPRSHPDRYSYVRDRAHKSYPQSTYRWDPQRQTWYYTGGNWRYWNPMRQRSNLIVPAPDWPPVPYGVYVEPR